MFTDPAWRATMLPPDQLAAASSTSRTPSGVAAPPPWAAISTMPEAASNRATIWKPWTRSLLICMAMPMVKNTWVCTTSEARPGEMWPFMATNSRPNCPAPISTP